jgi:repressor LexA
MKIYTTRWLILDFIRNFIQEKDYAPTIAEIKKGVGISSSSVVDYHLNALEREGSITREAEVSRGIHVSGVGRRARTVPMLGVIAAGDPIPVPTEETWQVMGQGTVDVPAEILPSGVQAYALRVKGTSMIDALVDDGDIVVLRATNTADDGDMVAAWLTDREKATLKRLYHEPGRIRLQPANRTMKPIYVDPDQIQVQGKVIAVLRTVK